MFYLTTHSTHFIYGYMASDIWLRTKLIVRKETRCRHIGYSFRLTARVLLCAPSHSQDSTYHGLCYTSRGALVGTSPPWRIDPTTHRTMSERSYHGATSRSSNERHKYITDNFKIPFKKEMFNNALINEFSKTCQWRTVGQGDASEFATSL